MKKYLINGAMALIVGGFLASCTHDDVGAPATVNDRTKSFDEMFTELYGPIAENHNWGFATVAVPAEAIAAAEAEAATRAATRAGDCPTEIGTKLTNIGSFNDYDQYLINQGLLSGQWNQKYLDVFDLYNLTNVQKSDAASYKISDVVEIVGTGGVFQEQSYDSNGNCHRIHWENDLKPSEGAEYVLSSAGPVDISFMYGGTIKFNKFGYFYYNEGASVKEILSAPRYILMSDARPQGNIKVDGASLGDYDGMKIPEYVTSYENSGTDRTLTGSNYKLAYFGADGKSASSYTFPAGTHIVFFEIMGNNNSWWDESAYGGNIRYSLPWINKYFYYKKYENHPSYQGESPQAEDFVTYKWKGQIILGMEDEGGDDDMNDILFFVNGNFSNNIPEIGGPSNPDAYQESKTKKTYTHKKIVDQGRVFCEDIATANMKVTEDIDYNDIVFDARVWQIYDQDATTVNNITSYSAPYNYRWQYDISLLATGGTIEEKINGIDVHNKFGVGQSFMVNTWTPNCVSTLSGQWNTRPMEAVDFSYTLKYNELPAAPSVGINTIPIEVHYGGKQMVALENRNIEERTGEDGNKYIVSSAPYKLCLPVGTQWPIERANIQSAYPDFTSYVSSPNYLFYKGTPVSDKLYTQAPESSIQKDGKTTESPEEVTQSGDAENSNVYVVWKGDESKDGSAITLYNFTFQSGQTLRFFGSGTITVVCGEGSSKKVITDGSMSAGYVDAPIDDAEEAAMLSQGIFVTGSFTLTKIVVL